jgi:hypothetical protein
MNKILDPRTRRGRPPVFSKAQRRTVASYLRKFGLTVGLKLVKEERAISMSIPTASKIAEQQGITFLRGRPVLVK